MPNIFRIVQMIIKTTVLKGKRPRTIVMVKCDESQAEAVEKILRSNHALEILKSK